MNLFVHWINEEGGVSIQSHEYSYYIEHRSRDSHTSIEWYNLARCNKEVIDRIRKDMGMPLYNGLLIK